MDQNGIGATVLSVSSPALGFVDGSKEVMENLRRLYFDLTASTHPGALAAILRLMPTSQLLLGFDFPFMPPATVAPAIASLESFEGLSSDGQQAIASGNARRLLPKVGAR